MANKRPSFFSLPALLLMAVLLATALYLLFPRQAVFENLKYTEQPDALSLAYLELLLRADPDNQALRRNLARMQGKVNHVDKALETLRPLTQTENVPPELFTQVAQLLAARMFALPEGTQRQEAREPLFQWLQRMIRQPWDSARKQALLPSARQWLTGHQYLSLLEDLFAQFNGADRLTLGHKLATQHEALGQPGEAAAILRSVRPLVPESDQAVLGDRIIRLELAAGNPSDALDTFQELLANRPVLPNDLRRGIELAHRAGNQTLRARWLGELAELEPDNQPIQRALVSLQLGNNQIEAALQTARRVVASQAEPSLEDRRQLARIAEWNGHPAEAMGQWHAIVQQSPSEEALERAVNLAIGLQEWEQLASVLGMTADRRQLPPSGYIDLADTLIRTGALTAARERLEQGLARFPNHTGLRQRQLTLLVNTRQLMDAITLLEGSPGLTDAERLQLADLYWRARNPEAALDTLGASFADPELDLEAAGKRIDLARILGNLDVLRETYDFLRPRPLETLSADMQERLLDLAASFHDWQRARALAEARYQDTGEVRHLAAKAEFELTLGLWDSLRKTLRQWRSALANAPTPSRYWTIQALVHQYLGQPEAAQHAFQRAAERAPGDRDVMANWAWFLIGQPERLPGELPLLLDALSRDPSPETYGVLAWGSSALGDIPRSLYWFRTGESAFGDQPQWMLAQAQRLQDTGANADANRLMRRVAAMAGQEGIPDRDRFQLYRLAGDHRRAWRLLAQYQGRQPLSTDTSIQGSDFEPILADYALEQDQALVAEALLPPAERAKLSQTADPRFPPTNQALQFRHQRQNLGRFSARQAEVSGQYVANDVQWRASAAHLETDGRGLLIQRPDPASQGYLEVRSNAGNFDWTATLGQLARMDGQDAFAALAMSWQPGDRWSATLGYRHGERTPDSAEAWWLTARDRTYATTLYTPFPRLSLGLGIEQLAVLSSASGQTLGKGWGVDASATYTLFRSDPAWRLGLNYRHQTTTLAGQLDGGSLQHLSSGVTIDQLLTRNYKRIGLSSQWVHGQPGSLYRTTPSPRVFLGLGTGYVLSTSTPDFGAEIGIGWRVAGDDDLAVSAGWTSEGLDGDSRANLNLIYTLYFGK